MSRMLAICSADIKERTRRFSYWAMVALCLFAAFLFVPNPEASFRVLALDSDIYAQASNPTWVPMASALCSGLLLPLLGFSYVKNAIGGDRDSGVMNLLQTARLPRLGYVCGKFISSCGTLLSMLGVLALGAVVMVVVRFPEQWLNPWALVSPFIALVPGIIFTAALAVFCETVPFLRTKAGSALAILGIFILQVQSITSVVDYTQGVQASPLALFDIAGYQWLFGGIHEASIAATGRPIYSSTILGGGDWISNTGTSELVFEGLHFNPTALLASLTLLASSVLLVFVASVLLERRPLSYRSGRRSIGSASEHNKPIVQSGLSSARWVPAHSGCFSITRMVTAEVMRLTKTVSFLWLFPAVGLLVAMCLVSLNIGITVLLPVLYGWSILLFSSMGSDDMVSGMDALYRTISGTPVRQAAAAYAAGAVFSLILAAPVCVRVALDGNITTLCAIFAWVMAVPAWGLTLGRFTQSPRPFQIMFIILLYMVLNMPQVFFPAGAAALVNSIIYFVLAVIALALLFSERLQVQR